MKDLSKKKFIVIDLGSGRYVQTKVGHEYYNLIENQVDGRFYGYCPPHDDINIRNLGAGPRDNKVDDVMVIYTTKVKQSSNRIIVAFTDSATVNKQSTINKKLLRTITQKGKTIHCAYSIESDYLYNLESYPQKLIIDIAKYNPYMFRKQRFYKGKYKNLDEVIIRYLEKYLENEEFFEDELYQDEIQAHNISKKGKLEKTYDTKPLISNTGGCNQVRKNPAYAKQALIDSQYQCEADASHKTFITKRGIPYMEGHHLIPCTATNAQNFYNKFEKNIDCIENIVCLCPTCHRRIHFGSDEEKRAIIEKLYKKQFPKLKTAGINIPIEEIIGLYVTLAPEKVSKTQ